MFARKCSLLGQSYLHTSRILDTRLQLPAFEEMSHHRGGRNPRKERNDEGGDSFGPYIRLLLVNLLSCITAGRTRQRKVDSVVITGYSDVRSRFMRAVYVLLTILTGEGNKKKWQYCKGVAFDLHASM